jgi:capsular polysaccharide biosynthesis protein
MLEHVDVPAAVDFDLASPPARSPARGGVLDAARRRPLLAIVPLLAALALAAAAGLARKPVYTATAQLRVGGFDVSVPGALTGYATASVALASTYSFSVHEPDVVAAVARRLHVPAQRVIGAVSASPLPESPVFRVRARAASGPAAVRIANATAVALAGTRLGLTSSAERARRLRAFTRAAEALAAARAAQHQGQLDERTLPSAAHAAALARAEGDVAAAQIALQARRAAYLSGAQSVTSTPAVEVVGPAQGAQSDRATTLELLLVIGIAAGLAVGLALAVLVDARRPRRR